jgi:hypothetical protein
MNAEDTCRRLRLPQLPLGCLPLLFLLIGCGGGAPVPQPEAQTQIQQLTGLYLYYASKNNDLGPASLDDLKKWSKALPASERHAFGDLDKLFISPRDNQPYRIVPKVSLKPQVAGRSSPGKGSGGQPRPGAMAPKVIVYESTPVEGKRWVGLSVARASKLVTEDEFNQLVAK